MTKQVKILGEMGLFGELAHANIEKFKTKGVKKIITLDLMRSMFLKMIIRNSVRIFELFSTRRYWPGW